MILKIRNYRGFRQQVMPGGGETCGPASGVRQTTVPVMVLNEAACLDFYFNVKKKAAPLSFSASTHIFPP